MIEADQKLLNRTYNLLHVCRAKLDMQSFHKTLDEIWSVISEANRYVDEQGPWSLKKTNPPRMETVLYTLAEVIRCIALLVHPFMPQSMDRLLDQLNVDAKARNYTALAPAGALKSGIELPVPQGIFPRYVTEASA